MSDSDLLSRVQDATLEMPGSRKSIADFLIREGSGVANLSMAEVADLTFSSKPSLVRFAKAMGFSGWRDFRLAFVTAVRESEQAQSVAAKIDPNHPFDAGDSLEAAVHSVLALEQQALAEVTAQIDARVLAEASRRVIKAKHLVFFGAAPNSYFGELFAYKLGQIGMRCHVPDRSEWGMVARGLGRRDCAIISSYSGNGPQREPVSFISQFKEARVPTVAITNSGSNWLREQCDCVLGYRPSERYYSKISGYYSEQCMHFVLDALYSAVFLSNYDQNEVMKLHALISFERAQHQQFTDVLPS